MKNKYLRCEPERFLYLSFGILVALFVVGAVADWRGQALAKRLVPWGIGVGAGFFGLTELMTRAFIVFLVQMLSAAMLGLGLRLGSPVRDGSPRTRRSGDREPTDSLRDQSNVIGLGSGHGKYLIWDRIVLN